MKWDAWELLRGIHAHGGVKGVGNLLAQVLLQRRPHRGHPGLQLLLQLRRGSQHVGEVRPRVILLIKAGGIHELVLKCS